MAEDRTVRHPGRIKPHVVPPLSIAEIEDMRQRGLSRLYVDELDALCDQSLSALSHQAALETATRDKDQLQAALQALVDAEDNGANLDRYMDESGEIEELWQNADAALAAAKGQAPCDVPDEAAVLKGDASE